MNSAFLLSFLFTIKYHCIGQSENLSKKFATQLTFVSIYKQILRNGIEDLGILLKNSKKVENKLQEIK